MNTTTSNTGPVGGPVRTASDVAARVLTEILAPWVIVLLLPAGIAWQATHAAGPAVMWGLMVALSSSVLPMLVVVWGARTGRWDGHHVRNREERLIPFVVLTVLSSAGLALLIASDAPWPMVALHISMITALIITGTITAWWKISMHTAVASGAVVIVATSYEPLLWSLFLVVAAIGWSRVRLDDHTVAEVIGGAALGAIVGGGLYALLT